MGDFYGWVIGDLPPGLAVLGWLNFLAFSACIWLGLRFLRRVEKIGEDLVADGKSTRKKVEDQGDKTRVALYARDQTLTGLMGTVSSAVSDVRGWLAGFSAGRAK